MRRMIALLAALACAAAVPAAEAATVLHVETVGPCTVTLEAHENWPTLALVSRNGLDTCPLGQEATAGFLSRAAGKLPESRRFTSLFLGRVERYPWLSRALAEHASVDDGWRAGSGRPVAGHANAYVADALERLGLVDLVAAAFDPAGYVAGPASVEKVLVSGPGLRGVPAWVPEGGRLPFDALCHVTLSKP